MLNKLKCHTHLIFSQSDSSGSTLFAMAGLIWVQQDQPGLRYKDFTMVADWIILNIVFFLSETQKVVCHSKKKWTIIWIFLSCIHFQIWAILQTAKVIIFYHSCHFAEVIKLLKNDLGNTTIWCTIQGQGPYNIGRQTTKALSILNTHLCRLIKTFTAQFWLSGYCRIYQLTVKALIRLYRCAGCYVPLHYGHCLAIIYYSSE